MTSSFRKRKFAGEPIKDKKKNVPEPPKHGHKPKPREYVLKVRKHVSYYHDMVCRYPTKAARAQAIADHKKKADSENTVRQGWRNNYRVEVEFVESEE